jgi:hypothetical protein
MYVFGGTGSIMRNNILAKLQLRRTHGIRPSDGKARIGFSNEYLYYVLKCTVA